MKVYADSPALFARQLVADLLVVCWVLAWVWVGTAVHDRTMQLAGPGESAARSATSLASSMRDAGDVVGGVPLVGDDAATPFDRASDASLALADAGRAEVAAVGRLAFWLGLTIALVPILLVTMRYLPRRVRFVRDATAGRTLLAGASGLELFAVRALTHQPLHALARVSEDPVGDVRRGDPVVVRRLADLELRALGCQPPLGRRA